MKFKNKSNKWGITKDFIIKEYIQKKRSLPQIAKEIGVPYETVFWYKKKFGISSYSASFWMKLRGFQPKNKFSKGNIPWNKNTKGLMKAWNKGKKLNEEFRKNISEATKKALANPEIRKKISQRTKEAMNNPEIIDKIRKTQFKKGSSPWNKNIKTGLQPRKGIKHTEAAKKKISDKIKKIVTKPEIKKKLQKTQFKKGIIPWNKGKTDIYSKETIKRIKQARLKQIFPKKDTNAEVVLFKILGELGIKFSKHKAIKMICQADAFIEPNIVLFADGDYWHSNPKFYPKPNTKAQLKNIERDSKENSNLIKEGYIVRRFWEYDLLNEKEMCKEVIKKLIKGD